MRFVKILIISRAFRQGKLFELGWQIEVKLFEFGWQITLTIVGFWLAYRIESSIQKFKAYGWAKVHNFLSEIILWEVFTTLWCCRVFVTDSKIRIFTWTDQNKSLGKYYPRFYLANSLNRAPPCYIEQGITNAFKTHKQNCFNESKLPKQICI